MILSSNLTHMGCSTRTEANLGYMFTSYPQLWSFTYIQPFDSSLFTQSMTYICEPRSMQAVECAFFFFVRCLRNMCKRQIFNSAVQYNTFKQKVFLHVLSLLLLQSNRTFLILSLQNLLFNRFIEYLLKGRSFRIDRSKLYTMLVHFVYCNCKQPRRQTFYMYRLENDPEQHGAVKKLLIRKIKL